MNDNAPSPAVISGSATGIGINKELTASLRADFVALENDLEQANAMTLELHGQLAGKSNEFAHLKHVFEKTSKNLDHLQRDITELREERHRLANEAMKATALEFTLQMITKERDQLKSDLESQKRSFEEEISRLKEDFRKNARPDNFTNRQTSSDERIANPQAAAMLAEIARSVEQLRELVDRPVLRSSPLRAKAETEFINISFTEESAQEAKYT